MGVYMMLMTDPDEISPNEDLVNEFRLAHGDLEVVRNARDKVCRAIPSDSQLTICRELVRRGVWPHHYGIYGDGFLELRNAFRAPWAARGCAVLLEQWGIGGSTSKANQIYLNVVRQLGRHAAMLDVVLEAGRSAERHALHDKYKDAIEALVRLMDEERKKAQEE
jgi:hypothetical protein